MFGEQEIPESIQGYLNLSEADRIAQLAQSPEGVVAAIVVRIYENGEDLSFTHVADELYRMKVFPNRVTNRYIGKLVKSLGLTTERKNNGTYLNCSKSELKMLKDRYHLNKKDGK